MSLLTNLISYYKLNEASGNAADAHASNTLTDNNTVGAGTGKLSGGRTFNGTDEFFSLAGTAFRFPSGDFTISVWVNPSALAGEATTWGMGIARVATTDSQGDWLLAVNNTGAVVFNHHTAAGVVVDGRHTTDAGLVSSSVWTHIVVRYASGTYTIWTGGTSRSFTDAGTSSGWGNVGFEVGRGFAHADYYWTDLIDELGLWDRALSNFEISRLYGNGNGLVYEGFGIAIPLVYRQRQNQGIAA